MKFGRAAVVITIFCLLTLLGYLAAFYSIEHIRYRKGPWIVRFQTDAAATPAISISQPRLGITSATIVFQNEKILLTNLKQSVRFDRPFKTVPFGKILYQDLTFLPGVVTFDFFGHEIELLPRTLIVNKKEVPWKSITVLELHPTNKPVWLNSG